MDSNTGSKTRTWLQSGLPPTTATDAEMSLPFSTFPTLSSALLTSSMQFKRAPGLCPTETLFPTSCDSEGVQAANLPQGLRQIKLLSIFLHFFKKSKESRSLVLLLVHLLHVRHDLPALLVEVREPLEEDPVALLDPLAGNHLPLERVLPLQLDLFQVVEGRLRVRLRVGLG